MHAQTAALCTGVVLIIMQWRVIPLEPQEKQTFLFHFIIFYILLRLKTAST